MGVIESTQSACCTVQIGDKKPHGFFQVNGAKSLELSIIYTALFEKEFTSVNVTQFCSIKKNYNYGLL